MIRPLMLVPFACCLLISAPSAAAVPERGPVLSVVAVTPAPHGLDAAITASIRVEFDRPVDPASVVANRSFWAFGRWSGTATGVFSFVDGGRTVVLTPARPFSAGENVLVILGHDLAGNDGAALRQAGFSYRFWTRPRATGCKLTETDRLTTRTTPGVTSRAYGGLGSDLDGDGFLDLSVVNEDSSDLRVFLNRGDGSGLLEPFLQPPTATGAVPSPSEPGDFDGDGRVDVAVANVAGSSVSILLGSGDGTFASHQEIALAASPRGIAVLDADGDGDLDVAATENGLARVAVLINDGSGVFAAPTAFDVGGTSAWALGAADMDEDGVLDLVVGGRDDERLAVFTGDGDGTFSAAGSRAAGGRVWMIALGDVDGDGHEDVATGNSATANGSILLGDGDGALGAAQTVAADPFVVASDLGDLDGDGDLDWVLSSFGGDWLRYRNDGTGSFTFDQRIDAPQAASCALLLDLDNDLDLDLALIDELADELVLLANLPFFADGFEDGTLGAWDLQVP